MTNISEADFEETIRSIIHGETRVLTAELTIEELFKDKECFKRVVQENIQRDLHQFGIHLTNCNIEELADMNDSKYFVYLRQRAIEGANNSARVDVATARKIGDIGEQERKAETLQRVAQIEAETKRVENERDRDVAESNKTLSIARSEFQKLETLAQIEAQMAAATLEADRQRSLELMRYQAELEKRRAHDLVEAKVAAESAIERAEGEAEAQRRLANATLYAETKKAEALLTTMQMQSDGFAVLLKSCGGDTQLLQFYLSQNSGLDVDLAKQTAAAVKDMKPSVHVWNTGTGEGSSSSFEFLKQLMSSVPPMLDVLQKQTSLIGGNKTQPHA